MLGLASIAAGKYLSFRLLLSYYGLGGLGLSFSDFWAPIDTLWIILAVSAAYRVGSGSEDDD